METLSKSARGEGGGYNGAMLKYPVFCGKDCGGNACPLLAEVEEGRVTRIVNNPAGGAYLKGCSRGFRLALETYAPERILKPLVRVGPRGSGTFREAGWEEALDITAERLGEIRAKYGASAVLNRASAGVTGALHGTGALLNRFLHFFGGCTRLTSNYSNGAASFALPFLFGSQAGESGFDAATMQYAQMIILWGANVLETRQGAEVPLRLMAARRRGAQIVVIDPRRSATVKQAATWWLPCRPGTDAALMLAVLYVLITEGRVARAFVDAHSVGFAALEQYVLGNTGGQARSPEWAQAICGLPADEIRRFARAYHEAKPAMLFPGYSIQRVFAGEEPYRLAAALQLATGNFGRRGGSTGSMNNRLPGPRVGSLPVPARKGLDAVYSVDAADRIPSVPVLRWADAILEGRAGGYPSDIHAVYNLGSNFMNQGSDVRKNVAALEKIDFAVTHEVFLTPSARSCDVIFPAATALEKEDIGLPWLGNYLLYKPQVLAPAGQARSDYDALRDLAGRLGFEAEFSEGRSAAAWVQHFLDQSEVPDQQAFRERGVYLAPQQERVGLGDFAEDPLRFPLDTPSGRVEIASQRYQEQTGLPAIPTWQEAAEDARFRLRLITPKSPHRTHSQGSNLPAVQQKAAHALEMHPADGQARGIEQGTMVMVYNDRGAIRLAVRLTEDLMRGVVCLPEGMWFALGPDGVDQGGSANLLTATQGTEASTACIMHGIAVEVEAI